MVVYWKQVSEEISGATMICGVGEVYIFLRVGSTTTLRALTTLLLTFVTLWNNYFPSSFSSSYSRGS